MAKFHYRMQNILDIKEKLESQQRMVLAAANARLAEEQKKLQDLLVRQAGYETHLREVTAGDLDLKEIQITKRAIDTMKVMIRSQLIQVHNAEREVQMARNKLNEVMKERKMHEKLKEKAFDEFVQDLNHEESKLVDELVSYTHGSSEEE